MKFKSKSRKKILNLEFNRIVSSINLAPVCFLSHINPARSFQEFHESKYCFIGGFKFKIHYCRPVVTVFHQFQQNRTFQQLVLRPIIYAVSIFFCLIKSKIHLRFL